METICLWLMIIGIGLAICQLLRKMSHVEKLIKDEARKARERELEAKGISTQRIYENKGVK